MVPLYPEVSLFQGVGIEEFHWCSYFRSLEQGVKVLFMLIQLGTYLVSLTQKCSYFNSYTEVSYFRRLK